MDLQLAGKRALVTRSSDGIGKVIAKTLAAAGAAVAVHGRDESRTRGVVSDIVKAGGRAVAMFGDITRITTQKMADAATGPDYSACKAAVNNLTVSLSKDVGKDGITVNAVSPRTNSDDVNMLQPSTHEPCAGEAAMKHLEMSDPFERQTPPRGLINPCLASHAPGVARRCRSVKKSLGL